MFVKLTENRLSNFFGVFNSQWKITLKKAHLFAPHCCQLFRIYSTTKAIWSFMKLARSTVEWNRKILCILCLFWNAMVNHFSKKLHWLILDSRRKLRCHVLVRTLGTRKMFVVVRIIFCDEFQSFKKISLLLDVDRVFTTGTKVGFSLFRNMMTSITLWKTFLHYLFSYPWDPRLLTIV